MGDFLDDDAGLLPAWDGRAILLVDLDAFFASVEQLDHPEWKGLPVIVGGDPDKRGVVSTCSYEARKYGVRSAMPSFQAARLCPEAIWCPGNFSRYREVSRQVMSIIQDETPHVQQVSIDEAFADITPTRTNREHPVYVAERIQRRVSELGVTCSIGLASTKAVAKMASDVDKPNGLTIVYPGTEAEFLGDRPVRALSGIGSVAEAKLNSYGIGTLKELASASDQILNKVFGIRADEMRARAKGADTSEVAADDSVKSVSHERSFAQDIGDIQEAEAVCRSLLSKVGRRLRMKGLAGSTVTLKVRYDDRSIRTAQTVLPEPSDDDIEMYPVVSSLLAALWDPLHPLRLIGVGVSGFSDESRIAQDSLFGDDSMTIDGKYENASNINKDERSKLLRAFDDMKDRFGEGAIVYGGELRNLDNSTGSSSKNPADYR